MNVLMDFPGIGSKKVRDLAKWSKNLVNALLFLSDAEQEKYKKSPAYPKSITSKNIQKCREFMGLKDNERLEIILKEDKNE